jgi:hypothetical protein
MSPALIHYSRYLISMRQGDDFQWQEKKKEIRRIKQRSFKEVE